LLRRFGLSDLGYKELERLGVGKEDEIQRHDARLIQVVEQLGVSANGNYAELKVIEIPDNINYIVCEYDGLEHVAEEHRTWY